MSDLTPPPPPRRPAPEALRRRIETELERSKRHRRLGAASTVVLVAAVATLIAAVLGVTSTGRPMTAEPAATVAPSPTPVTASSPARSTTPAPTGTATAAGPTELDLDVRALSAAEIASQRTACWAKQRTEVDRPPTDATTAYARYQRWAGLDGAGWNESKVLIMSLPSAGGWSCIDGEADTVEDHLHDNASVTAVYEVGSSGAATCDRRTTSSALVDKPFQVRDEVALGRVRLIQGGKRGPWQTTKPAGGFVHFPIGLFGEAAWTRSVTAEFEFLDATGHLLDVTPAGGSADPVVPPVTRVTDEVMTCADRAQRSQAEQHSYQPPASTAAGVKACAKLMERADPGSGTASDRWKAKLAHATERSWGVVLSSGSLRYACSTAPTREVSAVVPDKATTARSSFWFAVNPIDATGGTSFWAAGRVPDDVTEISYVLPGGVTVPAEISATGHWMIMYAVDGRDLADGDVSTWDPVIVRITRSSGPAITYEIPFDGDTMCNQISHGC